LPKNEQFAKALRALREVMHLSQPEFAQLVGLRLNVITDWEQAHALPSFEKFVTLLQKLGPDADFLLKALAIQGEMVEAPRQHEQLHIAVEVIMKHAPRADRERWARDLEEARNKWEDREPSPLKAVRIMPGSNSEKSKVK